MNHGSAEIVAESHFELYFFVCVRSLDIWKRAEGWYLSRLERWRAETDSGFLALSINVNLIATVVKWSHEWNFSVVYIKPAVMNQSAPNQKDQFLLSFIFRPAMQFFIFRYMFCWTGISLFYCLKRIFSNVNFQDGILCGKAKIQNNRADL